MSWLQGAVLAGRFLDEFPDIMPTNQPGHRGTAPFLRRTGPPPCCWLESSFPSRTVISRARRSRHHDVQRVKRTYGLADGAGWTVSPP